MNHKISLIFLLSFICIISFAQKTEKPTHNKKCKPVYNKELGVYQYHKLDSNMTPINQEQWDTIFGSKDFKFIGKFEKYPKTQRIRMAYTIGAVGNPILFKVLIPKDDKEIEEEAKRVVRLLPPYKPCMCGTEIVLLWDY